MPPVANHIYICIRLQALRPPLLPPHTGSPPFSPLIFQPQSIQVCMSCYGQPGILRGRENIRIWLRQRTDSHGNRFQGLRGQTKHIIRMGPHRHTVICEVSAAAKASCILRWTSSIWHLRILCTNKCHRRSVTPQRGATPHTPHPQGGRGGDPHGVGGGRGDR